MGSLISQLLDLKVMTMLFAAIAAGATVLTLAMPLLSNDNLGKRMKAVALEREKMRQRERDGALTPGLNGSGRKRRAPGLTSGLASSSVLRVRSSICPMRLG